MTRAMLVLTTVVVLLVIPYWAFLGLPWFSLRTDPA